MQMAHSKATRNSIEDPRRPLGQVQPHRERALWNFLTWSFFVAQVLAADQLIGGQAKAAGALDLPPSDAGTEAASLRLDGPTSAEGTGSAAPDEVRNSASTGQAGDGAAVSAQAGQADGPNIFLDTVSQAQSESAGVQAVSGGHASVASEQVLVEGVTPSIANHVHVGLLDVVDDTVDPLLDTVENIVEALNDVVGSVADPLIGTLRDTAESVVDPLLGTVETVVGTLDDTLSTVTNPLLGTLGDVLPDVVGAVTGGLGDVIEDAVEPLTGVVEVAAKGVEALAPPVATVLDATDAVGDVLASAGELTFPVLASTGLDELFTGGRYTDYNLALQAKVPLALAESSDVAPSSSGLIVDVPAGLSDVGDADRLDDDRDGSPLPHIAIPGVLDELGLRGLGDGIV